MSLTHSKFLTFILQECFGETVRQAVEPLIYHGPLTLRNMSMKTTVPLKPIKECLQVLIQHNIVYFTTRPNTTDVLYHIENTAVISLFHYAKYCRKVESAAGKEAKALFSAVLRTGRISVSKLMFLVGTLQLDEHIKTSAQMTEIITEYFDIFDKLVQKKYLTRSDNLISSSCVDVPQFESYAFDDDAFKVPNICFKTISTDVMKGNNTRISDVKNEDDDILWKVNLSQFNAELKEDILTTAVEERMGDGDVAVVFRTVLNLGFSKNPNSDSTPSVSFPDIKRALVNLRNGDTLLPALDESLKLLAMDPLGIVSKTSDLNGGNFSVNVKEGFRIITITMIEKIVESRFGPTTARVFRLVRRLGYTEQDKLTQKAMMSSKLGRSLLYKLVETQFVTLKEIRKTYTIASSLTNKVVAFVFYVDFDTILRSLLEEAYQASINARLRYKAETDKHKRLLDKESKIDKILYNMRKANCTTEQLDEVKEMLTYPERKILSRVHKMRCKLISAQLHAHHTIFIINSYFQYQ